MLKEKESSKYLEILEADIIRNKDKRNTSEGQENYWKLNSALGT